ncbi:hypothetical protein [Streptomyces sp. NPDC060001]|uniref:deoxynucleotide monophosphate kinase family protein n=1 Tax=Streptomyces sp. NPDC060001 TaxID=3347032 RepID=UPI003695FB61
MGNVGIIGRARVGKDTAGKWLVDNRGYRRVGFADALKEAALKLDPIIDDGNVGYRFSAMRLSEVVGGYGWERAKEIGDTRRILQELGSAMRAVDPDIWLRAALKKVQEANDSGVPVVITDVRYPNEAESLRRAGFHLVYIERPGVPQFDHESEGALTGSDADFHTVNDGAISSLHTALEAVMEDIYAFESRRHYARL